MMGISRFGEVEKAVRQTFDVAIAEKVDAYFFLGDLADPDTGGDTFASIDLLQNQVLRCVRNNIHFIAIAGNHDICTDGTGATTLTPLRSLEKRFPEHITIAEIPRNVTLGSDLIACCLPYTAPSHAYEPEHTAKIMMMTSHERVIVLGHLMLPGIHAGSETVDMPRGREVSFPIHETTDAFMRFNGHYHRRQKLDTDDGGPPIIIPGSLCRLAFGEESNEPGFLIVEV